MIRYLNRYFLLSLTALFTLIFLRNVNAQQHERNTFIISSQQGADSSQTFFAENTKMYMWVYVNNLNVQNMKKAKWEIKNSNDDDMKFEGNFKNNMDGTFSSVFDLSKLPMGGAWEIKAKLKDNNDHEAEFETRFYYKDSMQDSSTEHDSEMEMEGTIRSIGQNELRVNNKTFYVNNRTQIKNDDRVIDFSELQVGDFVKIKAYETLNGKLIAIKIKVKNKNDFDGQEIEIKGLITEINKDFIVINGYTFEITAQTIIEGNDDQILSVSDLHTGMPVKIKAQLLGNGKYVAIKIELKEFNAQVSEFEIQGFIDSVGVNYIVISGQHIQVTSQTKIKINDTENNHINNLHSGMFAEVKLTLMNDGRLMAKKIEIENEQYALQRIRIVGAIDSVGNDFIILENYTIYTDTNTVILSANFNPIGLKDLQKGQIVKVKGRVQADGSILAKRIKVRDLWMAYFKIEGIIQSLSSQSITVEGITFKTDSTTIVLNDDNNLITLNDLSVGQDVHIKARKSEDGSFVAFKIKVEETDTADINITGIIQALTIDSITVNDIRFYVTNKTEISNLQDKSVTLDSLTLGQVVELKGCVLNDGTYLAKKIEVEEDPGLMNLNSALEGKSAYSIFVAGTEYHLTNSTIVLDSNYKKVSLNDLILGSNVTIWALSSDNESDWKVIQVQENSTAGATALNQQNNNVVIKSFILKQNYPNPFNPTTTIEFTLNQNNFANVRLVIYNALGQKVRTLFNGVLSEGNYKFQWDGLNDALNHVATGMYIYRLEVNGKAEVRQMILIK